MYNDIIQNSYIRFFLLFYCSCLLLFVLFYAGIEEQCSLDIPVHVFPDADTDDDEAEEDEGEDGPQDDGARGVVELGEALLINDGGPPGLRRLGPHGGGLYPAEILRDDGGLGPLQKNLIIPSFHESLKEIRIHELKSGTFCTKTS